MSYVCKSYSVSGAGADQEVAGRVGRARGRMALCGLPRAL